MKQLKCNCSFSPWGNMVPSVKIQKVSFWRSVFGRLPLRILGRMWSIAVNLSSLIFPFWQDHMWRASDVSRLWRMSPRCSPTRRRNSRIVLPTYSLPHLQSALYMTYVDLQFSRNLISYLRPCVWDVKNLPVFMWVQAMHPLQR